MECHLLFPLAGTFAMWKMLFFLWLVPGVAALIALSRAANGAQPIRAAEWQLLFGKSKQTNVSVWLWFAFAGLAIGFFILGVVQAVVLPNFDGFWGAVAPLFTGAAAAVLLILLLRAGSSRPRNQLRRYRRATARPRRLSDLFSR
jgi:TctA family transporter